MPRAKRTHRHGFANGFKEKPLYKGPCQTSMVEKIGYTPGQATLVRMLFRGIVEPDPFNGTAWAASQLERIMKAINSVVYGHGLKKLTRKNAHIDGEFMNTAYIYVSSGIENEKPTIMFETRSKEFVIATPTELVQKSQKCTRNTPLEFGGEWIG